MKTFTVFMTSTVIEKVEVEAETAEQAEQIAQNEGKWNSHDSHIDCFTVEEKN